MRQPEWLRQFARRLKGARVQAGLTQQQLAQPEFNKSFVSLLETARSYPSVETLLALARRTRTSLASLLFDPADLRLETALNLLHLCWVMDPARHGPEILQFVSTAEVLVPDMPAELRVRAMLARSRAAVAAGRLDEAESLASDAVELARRHQLEGALGRALAIKGTVEGRRGLYPAAIATLERALDCLHRTRSLESEDGVRALLSLAWARWRTGQIGDAQAAYQRALEVATAVGLPKLRGRALVGLGIVAWRREQFDLAVEYFSQAYAVFQEIEDLAEMGRVLNNLGQVRRTQGLHDEALAVLTTALRIREREGDPRGRSATLDELAQVLLALGRVDEAAQAARRAVDDARTVGDQAREAIVQITLARILRAQDRRPDAVELLRGAAETLGRLGMTAEAAAAAAELGLMLNEAGQREEAADYLARALTWRTGHIPAPSPDHIDG
ncbi:MAG: tetratricopeptide repeat protein [Armatimonadota bacterium]|nr:tetratricopeptide repeat protein [Armatimonadota bacterium]